MPFTSPIKELVEQGGKLFTSRLMLMELWQETAENFYVERADFTAIRNQGEDFAGGLTTSFPLLARRDLGNSFSSMLRPTETEWFKVGIQRVDLREDERQYLEFIRATMRKAMYTRSSGFIRATKEGDHDFAAFGQAVLTAEQNRDITGMLYRDWHLRDVVWVENYTGDIDSVWRKWKPTARQLAQTFGKEKLHGLVASALDKEPLKEINCMHIVVARENINQTDERKPFKSIYVDIENEHVIENVDVSDLIYIIPRWQTVSGSQYAYSPATVAALPDARLIQDITLTLLSAGQKYVDPPMLAVKEAIRTDIDLLAGGVTWVDAEYDERLGEVLRPLNTDKSGWPIGIDQSDRIQRLIAEAFFLNKLSLPDRGPEMTAFEVGQRIQEFIRNALPLFEPMEMDYNGAVCERTFETMQRAGKFGSPTDMPDTLRGEEIVFRFESPLHDAIEAQNAQKFLEAKQLIVEVAPLDPVAVRMLDPRAALRDALRGAGVPAKWVRDEEAMEEIDIEEAQKRQAEEILAGVSQGAQVAEQIGAAGTALEEGGVTSAAA